MQAVYDWCRRHRHLPVKEQHAALTRRLRGHFNYFGVSGNFRQSAATRRSDEAGLVQVAVPSQPAHASDWERFTDLLRWWPLPRPRITVQIWGG